jgi:urease accessory protein
MRAHARLDVALRAGPPGATHTTITRLRSDPPLVLRPTRPAGPEPLPRWGVDGPGTATVSLVAGAAGPVGGDQLRLDVEVGPGTALVLRSVAASLVLSVVAAAAPQRSSRGRSA